MNWTRLVNGWQFLAQLRQPKFFEWGVADHHSNGLGTGQHVQNIFDNPRKVQTDTNGSRVDAKAHTPEVPPVHG
jgi:hypothetical protein